VRKEHPSATAGSAHSRTASKSRAAPPHNSLRAPDSLRAKAGPATATDTRAIEESPAASSYESSPKTEAPAPRLRDQTPSESPASRSNSPDRKSTVSFATRAT